MIGAIVQARMTSKRCPGKVMRKINKRPMIDYLFERLSFVNNLDIIVLATTINKEDDPIVDYARNQAILYYRGKEEDVLDRYYNAGKKFKINHIVRITADCPLIDPTLCDSLIDFYVKKKADYAYLDSTFAEGLDCEIFSYKALEIAYRNAKKKSGREHVTQYFHNNSDQFKIITLKNKTDGSKYRFTVDEFEDFEVVKLIIDSLYRKNNPPFGAEKIKKFLDDHPEIFKLNTHIIRNEGLLISLKNDSAIQ